MIDIRSDTVTAPTPEMRRAMAEAEVGDDQYGDDPTVNRLESLGAEMLGKEAALFVPSGVFGNQLALFTWCRQGSGVLLPEDCHIVQHEAASAAKIAEVRLCTVASPGGVPAAATFGAFARAQEQAPDAPEISLVSYENATSLGRAVPLAAMDAMKNLARERKLPVHLDGARIFNAAAALGAASGREVKASEIAAQADSVMFCLSKGLCAPVGSLLAGPADFIREARRKRKIMGGGMRQAGVLAAAGIVALAAQVPLLAEDHRRARRLAEGLAEIPGIKTEPAHAEINMVFFRRTGTESPAGAQVVVEAFKKAGILINPPDGGLFRFVTHFWTGDRDIDAILDVSREVFRT